MNNEKYPIYKGLQKPLVFMGLQGRYIVWGAIGALGGFLSFTIAYVVSSFFIAILSMFIVVGTMFGLIAIKQKRGLHDKKINKGIFITTKIFK